jgi:autotransporter-associated beta strand protein
MLTQAQLSRITFLDGSKRYTALQIAGGEIIPSSTYSIPVFVSYISGSWNLPSTWGYTGSPTSGLNYPGNTDNVFVSTGHTVKLQEESPVTSGSLSLRGQLDLNGLNITVGSLTGGTGGNIINTATGASLITVGSDNSNTLYSAIINDGSGKVSFTKTGKGKLTLSGLNTYTGTTSLSEGTLALGAIKVLNSSKVISFDGGALSTSGFTLTTGSLLIANNNSKILLDTAISSTLTFADAAAGWGNGQLYIKGWKGEYNGTAGTVGKIFVGNAGLSLTAQQLSQITFLKDFDTYSAILLQTGELVPKKITTGEHFPLPASGFQLQVYPNPSNNITNINYILPEEGNVELSIYNVLGEKVAVLLNQRQKSGKHTLQYNSSSLSQGVYYCVMFYESQISDLKSKFYSNLLIAR